MPARSSNYHLSLPHAARPLHASPQHSLPTPLEPKPDRAPPILQPSASIVETDPIDDELEDLSGRRALRSSTVRVSKFDPFSISLGKYELVVSLVDTPGYGDAVNTAESFDVIVDFVESTFEKMLQAPCPQRRVALAESDSRRPPRLNSEAQPHVHLVVFLRDSSLP